MKITLIGSGNVATHLGKAFHAAGHEIIQVWSREYDHAEELASQTGAEPINKLELLHTYAEVYILAVSDDALYDFAIDLRLRDALVLHTAGSVPMSILRNISRKHGVLWSPQTFIRQNDMDYSQLPFCIEGVTADVEEQIRTLAKTVSPLVYRVDSQQRQWLHLAAVVVNNFGNAINAIASDITTSHGIPFEILHPLLTMTAEKIKHGDLWQQQTGPARRQDQKTIDRHRRMIADDNELLTLYDTLTDIIQQRTQNRR